MCYRRRACFIYDIFYALGSDFCGNNTAAASVDRRSSTVVVNISRNKNGRVRGRENFN